MPKMGSGLSRVERRTHNQLTHLLLVNALLDGSCGCRVHGLLKGVVELLCPNEPIDVHCVAPPRN